MKLKVMLDPGAIMPTRAHPNDAGLDLYSPCRAVILGGDSTPELELVESLDETERGNGGFGSTGAF